MLRHSSIVLLLGCATAHVQTVSLRVRGNVDDASVIIDDEYVGNLAEVEKRGVALPRGQHRVTVEKVGYFPWDKLVHAADGPLNLRVELIPIPE